MHLSLSELNFYARRAAFATGLPWGFGTAFGGALTRLAAFGHDPAIVAAQALTNLATGRAGRLAHTGFEQSHWAPDTPAFLSAAWVGPLVDDWLALKANSKHVLRIENADLPQLLSAYLAPCSIAVNGGPATPAEAVLASHNSTGPACMLIEASVVKAGGRRSDSRKDGIEGVDVDAAGWAVVQEFFARCNVFSDERSRAAGAGAGLVDRD
ncbi:MAG: hypothetical protein GKR94_04220 [Gammaproteobacteria bacterium]|nr:hypothetical protein [Gammaproteobacteria bacterium]